MHANPTGTQKLWVITHENDHQTRKRRVFCHNSQTCIRILLSLVNRPRTPKLWITHENNHKMQKQRVLGHNSQTCKSPWNPKNVRSSS